MNVIPIVFCFDDNLVTQAGVCISSLLANAFEDTFYDIFILHDSNAQFPTSGVLEKLEKKFERFSLQYVSVGDAFNDGFQIRGITQATYYRLLIPELILKYDKIMYHDVDVIFRDDLSNIYNNTDMDGFYVAGVSTPYSDIEDYFRDKLQTTSSKYIAAGDIIFNSKAIREDKLVDQFRELAKLNWKYQDMDVINVACKGRIKYLGPGFCVVGTTAEILKNPHQQYYTKEEAKYALNYGIIHYNGPKPWNTWCLNFDIWWEYYRNSVYFDPEYYFEFYNNKLDEYDRLPFIKRVKILLRYFKVRK
ncbi:glycosyltransferase family 8 protein [Sphingobacterium hotanense]|uniref:glycosyltransferase family 8 protein n=1 Tax=Sphingobacterium hotanense TaxID=649196 RepID=UPI0021A91751|nr:glycosyltransferase family 8 protein [Sphingobacterium hotanense]MCT1526185.1 glycosyltransferase family 8 protein [Sphingobacterium hotanense]